MTLIGALRVEENQRVILATDSYMEVDEQLSIMQPCVKVHNIGEVWYGEAGNEVDIQAITHYLCSKLKKPRSPSELYAVLQGLDDKLSKEKKIKDAEFIFVLANSPEAFLYRVKKGLRDLRAIDNYGFIGAAELGYMYCNRFYHANNWAEQPPSLTQGLEAMLDVFAEATTSSTVIRPPIQLILTNPLEVYEIKPTDKAWTETIKRADERAKLAGSELILEQIKSTSQGNNKLAYKPHDI
jgi:hypothetical protein